MSISTHRAIQLSDLMDRASTNRVRYYINAQRASRIGNRAADTHFTALAARWEQIRIRCCTRFAEDCATYIAGHMRQPYDADLGPYRGASGDPRAPEDDRPLDELTPAEYKQRLVEFCFCGLRYLHTGDWGALLGVVGFERARAAVAKATGAA